MPKGNARVPGKVALSPGAPELSVTLAKQLTAAGGELVTVQAIPQIDASFQHFICVVDLDESISDPAKEAFAWCQGALACGSRRSSP